MPTLPVVIDANVLYGIDVTDVLLTMATKRLFRPHWSSEILDEVRRNLLQRPDLSTSAVDYRLVQMNRALPDALVDAPPELITAMPINPKDRHVLALAVHVGAPIIVTDNLKDFPADACEPFGVDAMAPDSFLALQAELDPPEVLGALREIAARRRRPPRELDEILGRLEPALPTTVGIVRGLLGL